MFDEPSSYLDVRQRLKAAQTIRALCSSDKYVIAVEHDLSVLDYLSDFVCCLYGMRMAMLADAFAFRFGSLTNVSRSSFFLAPDGCAPDQANPARSV